MEGGRDEIAYRRVHAKDMPGCRNVCTRTPHGVTFVTKSPLPTPAALAAAAAALLPLIGLFTCQPKLFHCHDKANKPSGPSTP